MSEIRKLTVHDHEHVHQYIYSDFWGCIELAKIFDKTGLKNDKFNKDSGDYYGFFYDDKLEGVFLFTNNKRFILHFKSTEVTKKVDLLKAIKYYKPEYMSGPENMVEQIWKMFERTVKRYKYKNSMYMFLNHSTEFVDQKSQIYTVREAEKNDAKTQMNFFVQVERHFGRNHMTVNQLEKRIVDRHNQGEYLVLLEDNKIIAQAFIEAKINAFWQIGGVYTLPHHRGKGIAQYVMAQLIAETFKAGCIPILAVLQDNLPAVKLYERMGFEKTMDFSIVEIEF